MDLVSFGSALRRLTADEIRAIALDLEAAHSSAADDVGSETETRRGSSLVFQVGMAGITPIVDRPWDARSTSSLVLMESSR